MIARAPSVEVQSISRLSCNTSVNHSSVMMLLASIDRLPANKRRIGTLLKRNYVAVIEQLVGIASRLVGRASCRHAPGPLVIARTIGISGAYGERVAARGTFVSIYSRGVLLDGALNEPR